MLYFALFHRIYYRYAHIIRLHTLIEHTYSLVVNKLNPSIMNFKITSKHSEDWNQILLAIYDWTPNSIIWNPLRWIIWKLEQIRTDKFYQTIDWDLVQDDMDLNDSDDICSEENPYHGYEPTAEELHEARIAHLNWLRQEEIM